MKLRPPTEANTPVSAVASRRRAGPSQGFTLIELVAVVATFALIAAMVLPNLDLGGSRAVRSAASDLATSLELARERAIMTGRVHAVVIDLDRGAYWIEWSKPLDRADAAPAADTGERELQLVPPPIEGEALEPLFGAFGRPRVVEDPALILGVELDAGVVERGTVELRMDADGATDPAAIVVGDADGRAAMRVLVEPLADAVAVVHVE
jgi:prepilin-type N-terminal cleavage/methylation domain-containing protein